MQAEIWTKTTCPFCVEAKKILKELGISFQEYIVSAGVDEKPLLPNQQYVTRDDLLAKYPAAKTVPQIWIDGEHVGGCTDLQAAVAKGRFQ